MTLIWTFLLVHSISGRWMLSLPRYKIDPDSINPQGTAQVSMASIFVWFSSIFASLFLAVVNASPVPPVTYFRATRLDMNSGWSLAYYNATIAPWIPNLYILRAPCPLVVQITDAFCPGEMYDVFVNGSFVGSTSPVPQATECIPSFDLPGGTEFFQGAFSRIEFPLPAGFHRIAIKIRQLALNDPTGGLYIQAFVPIKQECPEIKPGPMPPFPPVPPPLNPPVPIPVKSGKVALQPKQTQQQQQNAKQVQNAKQQQQILNAHNVKQVQNVKQQHQAKQKQQKQ